MIPRAPACVPLTEIERELSELQATPIGERTVLTIARIRDLRRAAGRIRGKGRTGWL